MMPPSLRLALIALLFTLPLSSCGRTVQEDAPEAVTATSVVDESEYLSFETDDELYELMLTFRNAEHQSGVENAAAAARASGNTDLQIAEAMGMAWLRAPRKRVMISVAFVRFKSGSQTSAAELDAAYEYGHTPPAAREAAANNADEEAEEEAAPPRRRRGLFSWIPGL